MDVLLVWFSSQDNQGSPWSIVIFNKAILLQFGNQFINHSRLMRSIPRRFAADWFGLTSVYMKKSTTNVLSDTLFSKHIPVFLDEVLDLYLVFTGSVSPLKVAFEFTVMFGGNEFDHIIARGQDRLVSP